MEVITIVARRASDNVIGSRGIIPWYIPEDVRFFRKVTNQGNSGNTRNICIMGRKTYQSLGVDALPQRTIFVISSSTELKLHEEITEEQVRIYPTPREALSKALEIQKSPGKIFICGGENVYRELIPHCSKIYLTEVYRPGDGLGDTFFPSEFLKGFSLEERSEMKYSTNQGIPFEYCVYRRDHQELPYLNLCKTIIERGDVKEDRTGTGTISYFGPQLTYDLSIRGEFPLLTTKRVFWKGVVEELLWFIRGETDANLLSQKGVKIWDGNTTREFLDQRGLEGYEVGDIGPGYGFQWRHWGAEYKGILEEGEIGGIDQLKDAVRQIRETPESRRIIVSAWNVSDLNKMALPPCHLLFQFNVSGEFLDLKMYQRSADWFLGVPFNIASYALLLRMVCHLTGKKPRFLILTFGDAHVYKTHLEQIKEQISREPYPFPTLEIVDRGQTNLEDFQFEDFKLVNYKCHPSIKAEMAV